MNDTGSSTDTQASEVVDRKGASGYFNRVQFFRSRFFSQLLDLAGKLQDRFLVGVFNVRYHKTVFRIDSDTDVDGFLEDDLLGGINKGGVKGGKVFEGIRSGFY